MTENKVPAAIILPPTEIPVPVGGLPSEFFMNYDAFKAVKPRTRGGTLPKREMSASWCNPLSKEMQYQGIVETDEELERAFCEQAYGESGTRDDDSPSLASLASGSGSKTTPRRPPVPSRDTSGSVALSRKSKLNAGQQEVKSMKKKNHDEDELRATIATKDTTNSIRSPRGAGVTNAGTSTGAPTMSVSSTARAAATTGGRSLLHQDIAPLYLKFLNSKEVQKTMRNTNPMGE